MLSCNGAENPTSMSAGYGIEENYPLIKSNLTIRYGQETAESTLNVLHHESDQLIVDAQSDIYQARRSMQEALENSEVLGQHFVRAFIKSGDLEKQVVSLISKLNLSEELLIYDEHESLTMTDFGKKIMAYIVAIGVDMPPSQIESLLIKSGLVNKLLWQTTKKNRNIELVVPNYVKKITDKISKLSIPVQTHPLFEVISKLSSQQAYSELCMLDEMVQQGGLLRERYDQRGLPAWKGIVGKYEGWVAVAPNLLETLESEIRKIKIVLVEGTDQSLNKVMETMRSKYWPRMEIAKIKTETDSHWKVELGIGRPVVVVTAAPWLTPSLVRLSGGSDQQLVVFLTNQSFPRAESLIYTYRTFQGVTLVGVIDNKLEVKKYSAVDPFIDEIINAFQEEGYQSFQQVTQASPSSVQESEVLARGTSFQAGDMKKPEENIERAGRAGEIIIGNSKSPQQWGILGLTTNSEIVKFDLNAPHIIFVCGKMGSGKGYAIGVLCEMLTSKSIPGICSISRPATVIVLYNPREDKRSEFWSIRYQNDVSGEVENLRNGLGPLKIMDDSKFRVFVDPFVFEKAADLFKGDYGTQNVFSMHVDQSSLTGKEWAIVLSAGEKTDQLYVKQLFSIIENRQFEQFDLDTVKSDVLGNEKLDNRQKNLALQRLEILQNYLRIKPGTRDFAENLAIGGVNVFDFRKTIRTPDDVFSVMTLILSILQTKKGLENEPFVFVINEAHDYFKGSVSEDFVESIEFLIRRKRHGANWLMLDTHFPDDVDEKVIKLADIKMVNFLDITVNSRILNDAFKGKSEQFSKLNIGQTMISADESSLGKFVPIVVNVRPRLTKHGAPTKTAIG